jgi:hypothetical protein
MHMVGHHHPGMNFNMIFDGILKQPMSIGHKILLAGKANLPIIAALYHMLGNINWAGSG